MSSWARDLLGLACAFCAILYGFRESAVISALSSTRDMEYAPDAPGMTSVEKHVQLFFRTDMRMDADYIEALHREMGMSGFRMAAKALTIARLAPNASALAVTPNPARSGVWLRNGSISEERWAQLAARAVENGQARYVLRAHYADMVRSSGGYAAFPISWDAVTDGSLTELFRDFADACVAFEGSGRQPAWSVERLRAFYEDSRPFFRARTDGWRPPPCP
jgi:hypothetical protein